MIDPAVARCGRWLMIALVLAGEALAQPAPAPVMRPIEYGYPDQSIFVATVDANGQVDSPMNRLAAALMAKVGLPLKAAAYPAARMFGNLQDGTTQFSILVRAPQLEACCLFSRQPVYSTELNAYAASGGPLPISRREDLVGQRVITIRGYSYGGLLKFINDPVNHVSNEVASTHKAAFEMLKAGRADYVLDYASAARDILAEGPIRDLRVHKLDRLDIFLVLARAYPDAQELMRRLEAAVQTLDVPGLIQGKGGARTATAP